MAWSERKFELVLVTAVALLVAFSGALPYAANSESRADVRITLELNDRPLHEALEALAEAAGWRLEVIGSLEDRRVSVVLRGTTLRDSLNRILRSLNYTVSWLPGHRLVLHMLTRDGDGARIADDGLRSTKTFAGTPPSPSESIERQPPPSQPGEADISIADVDDHLGVLQNLDPAEIEVLPPSQPGTMGPTQAELEFFSSMYQPPEPADMELFPPEGGNGFGPIASEFEMIKSTRPALTPSQIEVFPPELSGERGLTLEQLQSIPQPESFQPSPEDDLPPD